MGNQDIQASGVQPVRWMLHCPRVSDTPARVDRNQRPQRNGGRHRRNSDHARTSHDPDRLLRRTQGNASHNRPRNYVTAPPFAKSGVIFFDKKTSFC